MAWKKPLCDDPLPFTAEEQAIVELAKASFVVFLEMVFPASFEGLTFPRADGTLGPFSLGWIHYHWAEIIDEFRRICVQAPRYHLKSTTFNHAFTFWQLFRTERDFAGINEGIILSFSESQAIKHVQQIRAYIKSNRFCRFWIDNNPSAKSLLEYTIGFSNGTTHDCQVSAYGIRTRLRGSHPVFIVADDILADEENPLESEEIKFISETIFMQGIAQMPMENDWLVMVGTPQSEDDVLNMLRDRHNWYWAMFPTPYEDMRSKKQLALWPEMYDLKHLARKLSEIKERAFSVEFKLVPVQSADALLSKAVIARRTDKQLRPARLDRPFERGAIIGTYGGLDVGKHLHPSHFCVFGLLPTGDLAEVYEEFMDNMDYPDQVAQINRVVAHFGIRRLYYDNTNTVLEDRGLSHVCEGMSFSLARNRQLAQLMENYFLATSEQPGIILLEDPRQARSIGGVTKAVKAIEVGTEHSDAFWSVALALKAAVDGPKMTVLGDGQMVFGGNTRRRSA